MFLFSYIYVSHLSYIYVPVLLIFVFQNDPIICPFAFIYVPIYPIFISLFAYIYVPFFVYIYVLISLIFMSFLLAYIYIPIYPIFMFSFSLNIYVSFWLEFMSPLVYNQSSVMITNILCMSFFLILYIE